MPFCVCPEFELRGSDWCTLSFSKRQSQHIIPLTKNLLFLNFLSLYLWKIFKVYDSNRYSPVTFFFLFIPQHINYRDTFNYLEKIPDIGAKLFTRPLVLSFLLSTKKKKKWFCTEKNCFTPSDDISNSIQLCNSCCYC